MLKHCESVSQSVSQSVSEITEYRAAASQLKIARIVSRDIKLSQPTIIFQFPDSTFLKKNLDFIYKFFGTPGITLICSEVVFAPPGWDCYIMGVKWDRVKQSLSLFSRVK